jgi:predicted transcriptional regulator
MLEYLFRSISTERILIFLFARDEGYAREISRFYETEFYSIYKQLTKLEYGGVIMSRKAGNTRLYSFNPRYPFLQELKSFLEKVLSFYPEKEREKLVMYRRRPRRSGKKL